MPDEHKKKDPADVAFLTCPPDTINPRGPRPVRRQPAVNAPGRPSRCPPPEEPGASLGTRAGRLAPGVSVRVAAGVGRSVWFLSILPPCV